MQVFRNIRNDPPPTSPFPSTSLRSHPPDASRTHSTASTAVPPSFSDDASILTELPSYHDTYRNGQIPLVGLEARWAFPKATNVSMVQDWYKSGVDFDVLFFGTDRMVLRLEGKVFSVRSCMEIIDPSTRKPTLHLRQDVPAVGLDFKLFLPSPEDAHIASDAAVASIVVKSGTYRGKPFCDILEITFTNTAAQPYQAGTSLARDKVVTLRTELNGWKDKASDVIRMDENGREIVVARIVRQLVSTWERFDMQVGPGVDVRMITAMAACMKYRRRE